MQRLSEAVVKLERYIATRFLYRASDDVAESVARWIVVAVSACLSNEDMQMEDSIVQFCDKAEKIVSPGIPDEVVMQLIEDGAFAALWQERTTLPSTGQSSSIEKDTAILPRPNSPRHTAARFSRSEEIIEGVRSLLRPSLKHYVGKSLKCSISAVELNQLIRTERWADAMQLAAALSKVDSDSGDPDCLSSSEVAFIVSKTKEELRQTPGECSEISLGLTCLAIACSDPTSYTHVISAERISQVISQAFIWIAFEQKREMINSDLDHSDLFIQAIQAISSASDGSKANAWVNKLFMEASEVKVGKFDGGSVLANSLWEAVTNSKKTPIARSEILGLLYRLRRIGAIESLIRHAASQRRAEIRLCLQTISKIASDPELRRNAHTKFHALQERSSRQMNTKPWLTFFGKVLAEGRGVGVPLECSVESDQIAFDENDDGLIEVELQPDPVDPPSELSLTLTTIQEKERKSVEILLPLEEEPLLKSKLFTVTIPAEFLQSAGEVLRISAHFSGVTALARRVDLRQSWELPFSSAKLQPIDRNLQKQSWPGATGDPVKKRRGFYGRESEFKELDSYINDNNRPRSVMLYGQRRIGKTSLLLEMVDFYPPSEGRACGFFVDVGGLDLSGAENSMQRALFSCIVSAIDSKSVNEKLRKEIRRNGGENARMDRLTKNLTPEISLADALQELSNIISRCTDGKVRRLAIFIDEFDRFVEPLLDGREDEVDRLMRGLREVVQTSQTISLVLAGSGLQRMLVDDYGHGFHGSIDEIEIEPFQLPKDRDAIEATLLPSSIGDRLCPPDRRQRIVEHGQELCGGHPYYLAMLGLASAHISRGHPLTPALMNRVVENMVRGKIPGNITSSKFYKHIFESLKRLPRVDQNISKILLANIAATTTQEYAWTTKREAIDVPELVSVDLGKRYAMLLALAKERAIDVNDKNGTVKIRVPVTAAALREDSDKIRHEASSLIEEQSVEP